MTLEEAIRVAVDSQWTVQSLQAKFGLGPEEDVTRLEQVTERDARRITRYLRSLRELTRAGGQGLAA